MSLKRRKHRYGRRGEKKAEGVFDGIETGPVT